MDKNESKNNIKDEVLKKISSGEVCMKSKSYFFTRVAIIIFVLSAIFITSSVLVSYIMFSLQVSGRFFLLGFGLRGLYEFLLLFPWFLLAINIALLIIFDYFMKSFSFGYHSPAVYLFLWTLVVITLCGYFINFTPFHKNMMYRAEDKKLPYAMGGFYEDLRVSHREVGMFRGVVSEIGTSSFVIKDSHGSKGFFARIIFPKGVATSSFVEIGEGIFIAGDLVGDEISPYGVHKLSFED